MKFQVLLALGSVFAAQTCKTPLDVVVTVNFQAVEQIVDLVNRFDVGLDKVKFEIFSLEPTYKYWCDNVPLYSSANAGLSSLIPRIRANRCDTIAPYDVSSSVFSILYGSGRENINKRILVMLNGASSSGYEAYDIDRINSLGRVEWTCALVGTVVVDKALESTCVTSNTIKIANPAAIPTSIPRIADQICNGAPTVPAPTMQPTKLPTNAPSAKVTGLPTNTPVVPTQQPSKPLTFSPMASLKPTKPPTSDPTKRPTTKRPTKRPPTKYPTKKRPTRSPTDEGATQRPTKRRKLSF